MEVEKGARDGQEGGRGAVLNAFCLLFRQIKDSQPPQLPNFDGPEGWDSLVSSLREDKGMSQNVGETGAPGKYGVRLKKQIVSFEEGNPAQEPLFINYADVAHAGGSAYIDVGVIPLDEILARSPEATFMVLTRLVMSLETLTGLRDQISLLLQNKPDDEAVDASAT